MKLANKFGSITKLKGNRRNPFMIREGISGKQKILGYAPTREAALKILTSFNGVIDGLEEKKTSVGDLFQSWVEKRGSNLSKTNLRCLKSAWIHCSNLSNLKYTELRAFHMQECVNKCERGYATQSAIKNLFHHLDRYAIEIDLIEKSYSHLITSAPIPETNKTIFSLEERQQLWANQQVEWVDSLLIFLYTGFRISELLDLKKSQVDLEKGTIVGGCKTEAGRNRTVPIHPKIRHIIENRMGEAGENLLSYHGKPCSHFRYRSIWRSLMKRFGMSHTPHECRHTFRSMLDSAGANAVCIDRMMGHRSQGTGERIYTHKTLDELRASLELVTN